MGQFYHIAHREFCYTPLVSARVIQLDAETFEPDTLTEPAACVREGGLVIVPTETVYGIAVNLEKKDAVRKLLELRESSSEKLLTLHVAAREEAVRHAAQPFPAPAQRLMRRFWPGPLTLVLPRGDGDTIGIRFPNHRVACELVRQAAAPVGIPSANRTGEDPAVDAAAARKAFGNDVDFILDSGPTRFRQSSTVVRVSASGGMEVLRVGAIPKSVLQEAGGRTIVLVCTGNTCRSPMAEALLRSKIARSLDTTEEGLEEHGFRVLSAGTAAGVGLPASEVAVEVMDEMGLNVRSHASKPVTVTMVEEAEIVFVMTNWHREVLEEWIPEHSGKVKLLDPGGEEIPDPLGGSREIYRKCAVQIAACLEKRIPEVTAK